MLSNQPSLADSHEVVGGGSLFHLSFWKWCRGIVTAGELAVVSWGFFHSAGLEDCVCCSLFL